MKPPIQIPEHLKGQHPTVIAEALGITRQHVCKIIRRALGDCVNCGRPAGGAAECERCAKKRRKRVRKRTGSKPWQAGMRGRPPKEAL